MSERNAGQVMDPILELHSALRQLLAEVYQTHVLLKSELLRLGNRLDEVKTILDVVVHPSGQHTCESDHNKSDSEDEDDYDGSTLVDEDEQPSKEEASS